MNNNSLISRVFNIPYVSVNDVDCDVLNEIIRAMDEIYNKYPALYKSLCSFGPSKYTSEVFNKLNNKYDKNKEIIDYETGFDSGFMSTSRMFDKLIESDFDITVFIGLNLNNKFTYMNYNQIQKELDDMTEINKYLYTLKYAVYHEFGHIICDIIQADKNESIIDTIYKNSNDLKDLDKAVSYYSAHAGTKKEMIEEALADIFALYYLDGKKRETQIVRDTMDNINKKYLVHSLLSDTFNINSKVR